LLTEHDDAWVELTDDFHELSTGDFLWSSERSGQRNLELRRPDGALEKVLTNDSAGFRSLVGVDESKRIALIAAGPDTTTQSIVAVPLGAGEMRVVAEGDGPATAVAARDGRLLWLRQDHVSGLPEHAIISSDGTLLTRLPNAMEPVARLPRPRFLTLDLPQGRLKAAVLLPSWAKPHQRFPVLDWVYGGPTVTTVARSALSFELQQWFADQGFVVVKIDNRGTPHRGRAFARAVAGSFADVPLGDQADALAALAAQDPALDLQHVGIIGASFGGYLSALAVLRRPDRFEAAVALAPVTDWLDYDTTYTERYLGLPSENASGYEHSSLLGYAKSLSRPLLLGHGTADDNVHFGHTLKLIAALEKAGHAPAVFLVPGQTHLFADQTTQEVLWANAAVFLEEELGR
jgi:dipeptidyl-peptidase-4